MNAMIPDLKAKIAKALRQSELGKFVVDIQLESDLDEFGDEFLRVIVKLKPTDDNIDDALDSALAQIEDVVAPIDHRYPSVRFLDAA